MSKGLNNFVTAWRELMLDRLPYALPADVAILDKARATGRPGHHTKEPYYTVLSSYERYIETALEHPIDARLHLGLLPQPWCGDLRSATVFMLLLNPGLNPGDYYAEYRVHSFKEALINNLRSAPKRDYPLLFLDPEFSWHPGARYYRARLHWLVAALAERRRIPYVKALRIVARRVCSVQLVPYHSAQFRLPGRILGELTSVALSKAFVQEHLLSCNDTLILVMPGSGEWNVSTTRPNVITYKGFETRAAHLSRESLGGKALAAHFGLDES